MIDLNPDRTTQLVWKYTDQLGRSFVAETRFGDFELDRIDTRWQIRIPSIGFTQSYRHQYQAIGIAENKYQILLQLR